MYKNNNSNGEIIGGDMYKDGVTQKKLGED
jgi:hypothetical protein